MVDIGGSVLSGEKEAVGKNVHGTVDGGRMGEGGVFGERADGVLS